MAMRKVARHHGFDATQPEIIEDLSRAVPEALLIGARQGAREINAETRSTASQLMSDNHVLQRRHFLEDGRLLKRPHNAASRNLMRRQSGDRLSIVLDSPRRRRHERADQLEKRAFPGAIRPDHREDRSLFYGETDVIDCDQATKTLSHSYN